MNKKQDLSEMISAMFGDQDSEVARLLIEIFEIAKNTKVETVSADKIQGYTAEEWQEIIDGGYLCEGKDVSTRKWVPVILERVDSGDDSNPFKIKYSASSAVTDDEDHDWQKYCRPAQIKGVMRPIFVEPIDRESMFHFFRDGEVIESGNWTLPSKEAIKYGAQSYIEV